MSSRDAKILVVAALACLLAQSALAQRIPLPAGSILKNVSLSWEGRKLIFHATFNQYGHEMPIYLQWHPAKGQGGIAEIDTIEQFGRDMPLEVTLISLEKNQAGEPVVYMGQPAPNTPRLEGEDAETLEGRLLMTNADVGQSDDYGFSLAPSAPGTLPRISAVK
jgi:hypothetical protein